MIAICIALLLCQILALVVWLLSRIRQGRFNTASLHQAWIGGIALILVLGILAGLGLSLPRLASPGPDLSPSMAALSQALVPSRTEAQVTQAVQAQVSPILQTQTSQGNTAVRTVPQTLPAQEIASEIPENQPSPPALQVHLEYFAWALFLLPGLFVPGLVGFALILRRHRQWKHQAFAASTPLPGQVPILLPAARDATTTPGAFPRHVVGFRTWEGPACSFGIFRPIILLPAAPQTPDGHFSLHFQAMQAHEEAHIHLNHALWNCLEEFTACLFWFNPLCRQISQSGTLSREVQADTLAAKHLGTKTYGEALIQDAQSPAFPAHPPAVLAGAWDTQLIPRVQALVQGGPKKHPLIILGSLVLALGLGMACCALPLPGLSLFSAQDPLPAPVVATDVLAVSATFGSPVFINSETIPNPGMDLMIPGPKETGFTLDSLSADVLAWADGEVISVNDTSIPGSPRSDWGSSIELRHASGWTSSYTYLAELKVQPGQKVTRGQVIAYMGTLRENNLLHFELRKDGTAVNPRPWLKAAQADQCPGAQFTPAVPSQIIQADSVALHRPFGSVLLPDGRLYTSDHLRLWASGPADPATGICAPLPQAPEVMAYASGIVIAIGAESAYSTQGQTNLEKLYVEVSTGNFTARYSDLGSTNVTLGQSIRRGDVLGWASKSHLGNRYFMDFKLSYAGVPIDPSPWIQTNVRIPPWSLPSRTLGLDLAMIPTPVMLSFVREGRIIIE